MCSGPLIFPLAAHPHLNNILDYYPHGMVKACQGTLKFSVCVANASLVPATCLVPSFTNPATHISKIPRISIQQIFPKIPFQVLGETASRRIGSSSSSSGGHNKCKDKLGPGAEPTSDEQDTPTSKPASSRVQKPKRTVKSKPKTKLPAKKVRKAKPE